MHDLSYLVLILKNALVLPHQEIKLELKDDISKKIIKVSEKKFNNKIILTSPIDLLEINPSVDDLPEIGVICNITNYYELPNGNIRVNIKGEKRIKINSYSTFSTNIIRAHFYNLEVPKYNSLLEGAHVKKLKNTLKEYINKNNNISNNILKTITHINNINLLTDIICAFINPKINRKIEYINELNALTRAEYLIEDMILEIKLIDIESKIDEKLQNKFTIDQEQFYLKEKVKEINEMLGKSNYHEEEVKEFRNKLNTLNIDEKIYKRIEREIDKFENMNIESPEVNIIHNYLDTILNLPWNKSKKELLNYNKVLNSLNKSHYGLEEIKDRIIDYVFLKNKNKDLKSPIICLVGPPGTGKTTISYSISASLGRDFYKISVGGLNDSTELIGSRRTYLGAESGKIIRALLKCESNNPVILIDEVDKMVKDYKGDPAAVLLDILDVHQNKHFIDNYIEEEFDLSNIFFILTANSKENIPSALYDRLEIIEINSYTEFEKIDIAKKYIIPRIKKTYNITEDIKISDEVLRIIINNYSKEAGVRLFERNLEKLFRKALLNKLTKINKSNIKPLLGPYKYDNNLIDNNNIGVVNIVGRNSYGGYINKLEVVKVDGTGNIITTGNLGDILKESTYVSLNYIQNEYVKKSILSSNDLHIHILDAQSKKDGSSAGCAITTAILSLIKNKKIPQDIAMTGEITLTGKIKKVGGIKEKLISCYNNNITTVFIPLENNEDLINVPNIIKNKLNIILVNDYKEIYNTLF